MIAFTRWCLVVCALAFRVCNGQAGEYGAYNDTPGLYGAYGGNAGMDGGAYGSDDSADACTTCLGAYEQCGGGEVVPTRCCQAPLRCTKKNGFYAQCLSKRRARRNVRTQGWDGERVACGVMHDRF